MTDRIDTDQLDQAARHQAQGERASEAEWIEQLQDEHQAKQLAEAIEAETAANQLMVRNEIRAAIGWLANILDSKGEAWVEDMTLQEALAGAGDWAHDNWANYQDDERTRVTQRKVGT